MPGATTHLRRPADVVDRVVEWDALARFAQDTRRESSLGIVWGRRRIGKSFLLETLAEASGGFRFEAVRGTSAQALRELGAALATYSGAVAPLALESWDDAVRALLDLGRARPTLVVIDELPYLLEAAPELPSIIQRALGAKSAAKARNRTRLVLCGSAIAMMRELLVGTAPLRGRAGLDLRMTAFDPRDARALHGLDHLPTAMRLYACIGGVAAYARDMVAGDLPSGPRDFPRWVCERVLSAAAPLSKEVEVLLSEDPTMSTARKPNLYHAALAAVAEGAHAHAKLSSRLKVAGQALAPILDTLVSTELLEKIEDPIRGRRPRYEPADSLLRLHYALLRPHEARLRRRGADPRALWQELAPTFDSRVVGPCFEGMARWWTKHAAAERTLGGPAAAVGQTVLEGAEEMELDVVVVDDVAPSPQERRVIALGEAKSGEELTLEHVARLEVARARLGARAAGARLLLFGSRVSRELRSTAAGRGDVEVIDLERLYHGS